MEWGCSLSSATTTKDIASYSKKKMLECRYALLTAPLAEDIVNIKSKTKCCKERLDLITLDVGQYHIEFHSAVNKMTRYHSHVLRIIISTFS